MVGQFFPSLSLFQLILLFSLNGWSNLIWERNILLNCGHMQLLNFQMHVSGAWGEMLVLSNVHMWLLLCAISLCFFTKSSFNVYLFWFFSQQVYWNVVLIGNWASFVCNQGMARAGVEEIYPLGYLNEYERFIKFSF